MVLPIHDDNPVRRRTVVTYLLILANVVVFLLEPVASAPLVGGGSLARVCRQERYFDRYAAIPKELLTNRQLPEIAGAPATDARGNSGCLAVPPRQHKVPFLSVLFAMFLHGGWLHLGGNMLFLFVFGNNVEDRLGRLRFLAFYLFCGYAAAYGFALTDPTSTTTVVGASGAIAGVLGGYLLLFPRARVLSLLPFLFFIPARLPAWLVLGSWFVLQYFYAQGRGLAGGSGVAYFAHVIGFLVGAALVVPLIRRDRRRRRPLPGWGSTGGRHPPW